MIIYIEKQAVNYKQTKILLEKFKNAKVIYINNYKNIFDKSYKNIDSKKSLIVAKLNSPAITQAPFGYGHTKNSYFFKTSLNCIFDCSYCFLKGAFKNDNMVVFVNYNDIKKELSEKIKQFGPGEYWFYSSDYSDILGMDNFTNFCDNFIEFFEKYDNVKMEIRTKSGNIKPLLNLGFIPKNTEISFSLNPQELINKYEKGTSSLDSRIKAINDLHSLGFKVGVRFLPLLPVIDYEKIYLEFVDYLKDKINFCNINSTFAGGLLFTKKDYNTIISKYPDLDILHMLQLDSDNFYRESRKVRDTFYKMFKNLNKDCILCLDE
ncbi:hypothetical protein CSB07_00415 [Candidatus Gracilibacteria bacterium]|nr:MAG: hypothetical protein CSB07_00415 [Candidatus Gracilibacteria bacterium]PIE85113.1 MAG: hypothetical protein CSA08_03650 [Candidatus Gracilibacteria bacterium]